MTKLMIFSGWYCLLAVFLAGNADFTAADISSIIPESTFNAILKYRNDNRCPGKGFYSYTAFVNAANAYPAFGTTGSVTIMKREIVAFLAQTSHETTGGWDNAPDGPYAWGYCNVKEQGNPPAYCLPSTQWPCATNMKYYGRGPIQLSWNYNYGKAGKAIGFDGINDPDIVSRDPTIAFKTALWFWMTPQAPKPSCHDVVTEKWKPTAADLGAGRVEGFGSITNIINGGVECGRGSDSRVNDRIGFYKRYCDIFGITYGANLDCFNQKPFSASLFSVQEGPDLPMVSSL